MTRRISDYLALRSVMAAEASRAGLYAAMYAIPALAVVLAAVLWVAERRDGRMLGGPL